MSLYLLRHEKRFPIPTYFTSLTEEGLENSSFLSEEINRIQPDIIYCSPFLRCLQTIYPYAKKNNKKVSIEYALYEFLEDPLFTQYNYKHEHTELYEEYPELEEIVNNEYQPHHTLQHITFPENTFTQLNRRLIPFIDYLDETYTGTNIKILIVSHGSIVSSIKHYVQTGKEATKDYEFRMGQMLEIKL
jgi:broad specificity phosphatase PhoE